MSRFSYDKAPCLDALVADIRELTSSTDFDLASLLQEIINTDPLKDDEFKQINSQNKISKQKQDFKKFFFRKQFFLIVHCLWICIVSFLFFPKETDRALDNIGQFLKLEKEFNHYRSHLRLLSDDLFINFLNVLRKQSVNLKLQEIFPDLDECIINNPLHTAWEEQKTHYDYCSQIKAPLYVKINELSAESNQWNLFLPIVFQEQGKTVTLTKLQQIFTQNNLMINSDTIFVLSNRPYIEEVEDLIQDDDLEQLLQDPGIHVHLKFMSYLSSHIIRLEFPQPHHYVNDGIRGHKSMILIDGHKSDPYALQMTDKGQGSHYIYAQANGFRCLRFCPLKDYVDTCHTFTVITKPGDVVIFAKHFWDVTSESFENDASLGFLDEFAISSMIDS